MRLVVMLSLVVAVSSLLDPVHHHCDTSDFEHRESVASLCCQQKVDNTDDGPRCLCPPRYHHSRNNAGNIIRCEPNMDGMGLLEAIRKLTFDATWHSMRYILPFLIYPIVVFFGKLALHFGSEVESTAANTSFKSQKYYENQFEQATVLTWTFKAIVLIFVSFNVLQQVGIETGDMIEITTVFSLGLSWSMRDWMASVWGCFMLAFCTKLTPQSVIRLRSNGEQSLQVQATGLVFVECSYVTQDDKKPVILYVPNSALVTQGFMIET